jgi:hypothetical protein
MSSRFIQQNKKNGDSSSAATISTSWRPLYLLTIGSASLRSAYAVIFGGEQTGPGGHTPTKTWRRVVPEGRAERIDDEAMIGRDADVCTRNNRVGWARAAVAAINLSNMGTPAVVPSWQLARP